VNQPVPQVTAADVERIVRRDFPADLVSEVTTLLEGYGGEDWQREPYRVRLAALKLAAGDLDELRRQLDWAKIDYRDVIAPAEYPGYSSQWLGPAGTPDEPPQAVVAADWEQYRGWLEADASHD
jgi:hypothetical protein